MARAKPCRRCGHSKTRHKSGRAECKVYYRTLDGVNCHTREDWMNERSRLYHCLCPKWLPSEIYRYDELRDEYILIGYEDGLTCEGEIQVEEKTVQLLELVSNTFAALELEDEL